MRPLVFEYPGDPESSWNETEFMFGDQILVAPVLWEGATKRSLRLPEGSWYDFWTGKKYKGATQVTVDAAIDRIPLFVRAGAVIPMQPVVQYVGEKPLDSLTFVVFPGEQTTSLYYEDDGLSFAYEKGAYMKRSVVYKEDGASREVVLGKAEGTFKPGQRSVIVKMVDVASKPASVMKGSARLSVISKDEVGKKEGWYFDEVNHEVFVSFSDSRSEISVSIR